MDKIRWGVLSTAKFARVFMMPAIHASQFGTVAAIASRDLARAKKTAAEFGIEKAYGSYQELLADKNVDAIYIPLPNHLHVPWSIRALKAKKHVLCEKPIALSVAEAEQLAGVAAAHPKLKVMEAFMVRTHPQWLRARAADAGQRLGCRGDLRARIVADGEMAEAHQRLLGVGGTTDVITSSLGDGPDIDADLLLCLDEARRQAVRRAHAPRDELLLYIVHGLLHCLGHDDHEDAAAAAMHAIDDQVLEALGVGRLYARPASGDRD